MTTIERSKKTKKAYLKRAKTLLTSLQNHMNNNYGENVAITPEFLIEWFLWLTKELSGSSFRQYKNSLVYIFEVTKRKELETALRELSRDAFPGPKPKKKLTSAMKTKKVTAKDEASITNILLNNTKDLGDDTLSYRTYVYFKATILTGLRPNEWASSKLKSNYTMPDGTREKLVLIVINGKATNGRSHGKYRHVILSDLSDSDIKLIAMHKRFVISHLMNDKDYIKYYDACRGKLYRTCKALWPNRKTRVSLYSGRHQFSANLKASGATRPEVAATMGHATDETASEHYGRKSAGRRGPIARSASHEVKRIRLVFIPFIPKQRTGPRLG